MSRRFVRPGGADAVVVLVPRRVVLTALIATFSLAGCSQDELALPTGSAPATEQPAPNAARWSDPASWPDRKVPAIGADVVIPAGTDILLDVSPPALSSVRIEGTLTADNTDLELIAGNIHVAGTLRVGTEKAPFTNRMVFTLTGDDPGGDEPAKVIAVHGGGLLELHGESRTAWTRLGATATAGSTQLLLDSPTDWRGGDRLVVASTS
ncbi:MAG TPA: G8 domain-containing protein, partial [Gemmatimonadaceae bacterium]|nr:G8 domain-containing protein [Gemmatimonadaceae bacterium]